jgi:3-hydroxyisobutyrate dehydrogenase-like beta-hydroxyacid dehydrogenase
VAKASSEFLKKGQIYVDLNSVSPDTKKEIDAAVRKSGADFVEAAVMAAVKGQRLKTPILMGGSRAEWLAEELQKAGLDTSAASDKIGVASAIKMCRSIVMKGLASLAIESLFTARRYGAEEAVLASFDQTYPSMGWKAKLPDQLVMRSVEHSKRRAAEMRESAETVNLAGLTSRMAAGAALMQDWLTSEMEAGHYTYKTGEPFSWQAVADAMDHRTNK